MTEVFTLTEVFLTLTEGFPCFFLRCKANARVIKLAKTGHGPHSSKLVVICVVLLLFVLYYVLFVCKYVLYYCHRVTTQLQLTNILYICSSSGRQIQPFPINYLQFFHSSISSSLLSCTSCILIAQDTVRYSKLWTGPEGSRKYNTEVKLSALCTGHL